jgi:AcrR family transcriptional regulator
MRTLSVGIDDTSIAVSVIRQLDNVRVVSSLPVPDPRERILRAATALLTRGGRDAVSTRAVSAEADVQAPAIYRQFGDMRGLLRAAAREVLAAFVRQKAERAPHADPLEELRAGWDTQVAFGLANPDAYAIMYAELAPDGVVEARDGHVILERLVTRIAESGQLAVPVAQATQLIHAGACGVTFSLIATPPAQRDLRISAAMRDAVIAAITVAPGRAPRDDARVAARAVALRAVLPEARTLSTGERELLGEWLDRLATERDAAPPRRRRG